MFSPSSLVSNISIFLVIIFFIVFQLDLYSTVPYQRCTTSADCQSFCPRYGYNRSECNTKVLRLSRICECHDCDFVMCATYCTKNALKFVGCSCFVLPSVVGQGTGLTSSPPDSNQLLTNECYDNKFYCQCSK